MHPVLVEIPLPGLRVPLGPALVLLALAGLVVALLGRRARAPDLVLIGALVAFGALASLPRFRGETMELGPMPIYAFGALLCASLLSGWFLTTGLAERDGLGRDASANAFLCAAVGGLLGSRVLYVITNPGDFHGLAEMLAMRNGGLVFYGGALGGVLGAALYLRKKRMPFLAFADAGVPSLALGAGLGRLGCYLAGCDYGVPLSGTAPAFLSRLGTFPRWSGSALGEAAGAPAWLDQVMNGRISVDATASLPVHPTELYESAGALLLFACLLYLRPRRRFHGQVFLAFVLGYGALRYLLEIVRDDPERGFYGPLGRPEVIVTAGAVVVAVSLALGPLREIRSSPGRVVALAVSTCVVVLVALGLHRSGGAAVQLSSSQWIAVATSVAVAATWGRASTFTASVPAAE